MFASKAGGVFHRELGAYMERRDKGYTLMELLVAMAFAVVMTGIVAPKLADYQRPADDAISSFRGFLKVARGKAIARTVAYTVSATSPTRAVAVFGQNCSDPSPQSDPKLILDLKRGATFSSTAWSVCFTSRGIASNNLVVEIQDIDGLRKQVEIMLGGAVRLL
jgi:Tfp pilus assembly protein FimT